MMRFLADENVASIVVARFRAAGLDVAAIAETAAGTSDDQVLALAVANQRILIAEDRDFGGLVVRQRMAVGEVVSTQAAKLSGYLVVIEPGRARIRPLVHRSDWSVSRFTGWNGARYFRCQRSLKWT